MRRAFWILLAGLALAMPAMADDCSNFEPGTNLEGKGPSRRLAIVLHGMNKAPSDVEGVGATIRQVAGYEDTDVLIPALPFSTFSTESPDDILVCLLQMIDKRWGDKKASGQAYESVLLVGHSIGSLYARKLYVLARGELPDAPFESSLKKAARDAALVPALGTSRAWAAAVDRIVLLAGINRGWSVDHHMPFWRMAKMHGGLVVNRIVQAVGGPDFTVMSARKGAPFVTQLRLQWLAMMECAERTEGGCARPAHVVQLLGTQDDLVPPGEIIDVVAGSEFSYHTVPHTNHADVVDMTGNDAVARARADVFRKGLTSDRGDHQPEVLNIRAAADRDVKHLVFVMHGIRDEGFWTERLGAKVRERLEVHGCKGEPRCKVRLEVSSYGYFPMLSFLKPGARNEKVEWLMDRYTEARARYPEATFYYVGHSHGTYLLKEALDNYEGVKFKRVVLAGSVLRSDHEWSRTLRSARVESALNLSATQDWVVAFFPHAMQMVGVQDLGGAGFHGFEKTEGLVQVAHDSWVVGGHGAAVAEDWWPPVAEFVATGVLGELPPKGTRANRDAWVVAGGAVAPLLWLLIAALLAGGVWLIVRSRLREWAKTLALVVYGWFVWFVLTSV